METKQIVGSNSNEILTRQTCGQSSGMAAGGKHRALAFYFSVRICCMFLMSKCRGESDLDLCMTSILSKRMPLRSADFRFLNVFGRKIRRDTQPHLKGLLVLAEKTSFFKEFRSEFHSGGRGGVTDVHSCCVFMDVFFVLFLFCLFKCVCVCL